MRSNARDARQLRATNEARCRRILDRSAPLEVDDLDWSGVGAIELDAGVIATLVYMRDVEGFTDSYVRGLGAHRNTLNDPIIRAFLDVWRTEEASHSAAIGRLLDVYAERRAVAIPSQPASPSGGVRLHERAIAHVGGPVGRLVTATHMAWGAANELLTMNGYRMLASRCGDPMLAELLHRVAAQEARHYSFYLLQAEWRLADSRLARAVVPRLLDRAWSPVGVGDGYKTAAEFQQVLRVLHTGSDGERITSRMERRLASLPGFERLRLYRQMSRPDIRPAG